mgnify:CR=1 FL=1
MTCVFCYGPDAIERAAMGELQADLHIFFLPGRIESHLIDRDILDGFQENLSQNAVPVCLCVRRSHMTAL